MERIQDNTYSIDRYIELLKEYNKLDDYSFKDSDSKEYILSRLEEVSSKKKEISSIINRIIYDYIEVFEKDLNKMTDNDCIILKKFIRDLNKERLEGALVIRISRLLIKYYKKESKYPDYVGAVCSCNVYKVTFDSYHIVNYHGPGFPKEIIDLFDRFDELPYQSRMSFIFSLAMTINYLQDYNENDLDPLRDDWFIYDTLKEAIKKNKELMEINPPTEEELKQFPLLYIDYSLFECKQHLIEAIELYYNNMNQDHLTLRLDNILPRLNEFFDDYIDEVEKNERGWVTPTFYLVLYSLMRWTGRITFDEFIKRVKGVRKNITQIEDEATRSQLLSYTDYVYIYNIYFFSGLSKEEIKEISDKTISKSLKDLISLKRKTHNLNFDRAIMTYVVAASFTREFDDFTDIILDLTVYSDKSLFIHTIMVKEISRVLFDYLYDHNKEFFIGVCDYDLDYISSHKEEVRKLLDDCAMFHDIGKFAMFEIVENSMRRLTDDEFDIIKKHPEGFNDLYFEIPEENKRGCCIRDVALTHHLWHDGSKGYPKEFKHTKNRPMSDIISIADSIDAATDFIGRPYNGGKTLDTLLPEFMETQGTRYSKDVVSTLQDKNVKERINYLITEGRKEVNYEVYAFNKVKNEIK
ncbi:MAG: hypothetical protein J5666_05875 [Bacilli bacterium]|nr:hypothetical protein [Bacilli bacterium]